MAVEVDDYEAFFWYIFEESLNIWNDIAKPSGSQEAQLRRVYWYVLGAMDDWNLADPKAQLHLHERFETDKDVKRKYMALAGTKLPGQPQERIFKEAWAMCFKEFQEWYEYKKTILDGMKRFHHAVRMSTDFIDIIDCGHWKVDFLTQTLTEKGLDTSIAVDMVALQDNYDVAVVLSGDMDSIPSIKYMKTRNKHVGAVEFVNGYPPEKKGKGFSSHLKRTADFVVRIYEMGLVAKGIGRKGSSAAPSAKAP